MENKTPGDTASQKDLFKQKLLEIRKDVAKDDRVYCAKKLHLSKSTVDKYIAGNVKDNDTAYKILTCLKKRIEDRAEALK